ncbi:hypothetical protein KKF81_00070 [Candidatus Micrarchaeota archaeon]|nr:hypothetical protein [Candidatus Micrarchaeota archaeon]
MTEFHSCKLADLTAAHIGNTVKIQVQITGELTQKAIPESVSAYCKNCNYERELYSVKTPEIAVTLINKDIKWLEFICPECNKKIFGKISAGKFIDFHILLVRDKLDLNARFTTARFQSKRVFIVGEKLPKAKFVELSGVVIVEPKTKDLTILVDKIVPLETEIEQFAITENDRQNWPLYFNNEAKTWTQIAPHIVGDKRILSKKSIILQLHSPPIPK